MKATRHSKKRTKQRLGVSKNCTEKLGKKALKYGVKHSDTKGSLKRYMDGLYLSHRNSNNTRIYNRNVYLFRDDVLITIMNLPNQFNELADKLQKKINENITQNVS